MASPLTTLFSAARVIDPVEQQEERLHSILKSIQATPEEKFEALIDLAYLSGILLRKTIEAEQNPRITGDVIPPQITNGSLNHMTR